MDFLHTLYEELISFLGIGGVLKMFQSGDYSSLRTLDGVLNILYPVIPLLLIIEIIRVAIMKEFKIAQFKMPFIIYVLNAFISRFISIGLTGFAIGYFSKYAIFKTTFTWYWLIYGYIIWEFSHFIYHFFAHKVRLFWCLHSTHHTPENMNLSVSFAHFFLEAPYADIIRTTICIVMGINPPLLFFIMFIDGFWGNFIHAGEAILKDGRLGFLNRFILTPSHHRVHHSKNPLYMDTNFCNLLNIWDRVFKTYQPEKTTVPPEYGITRKVNKNNVLDVYVGEFALLFRDIVKAPGIKNKILYIFMPPGWSHTGDHKTATVVKKEFLQQSSST